MSVGMAMVLGFLLGQESNVTSAEVGNIILLIWTFKGGFFGVGLGFHWLHPDLVYSLLVPLGLGPYPGGNRWSRLRDDEEECGGGGWVGGTFKVDEYVVKVLSKGLRRLREESLAVEVKGLSRGHSEKLRV
nr:hypothetical protein CFP56_49245 [Quercus suber]